MIGKIRYLVSVKETYKNWPTALLDTLGRVSGDEVIYNLRNGMKIKARPKTTDLPVINRCVFGKENDEFLDSLGECPVIIDIGAHIGVVSIYFAKRFPKAKIYSYEPFPENYRLLCENIKINDLRNVSPFKMAVSDKAGKQEFFTRYKFSAGCTLDQELISNVIDQYDKTEVDCILPETIFKMNNLERCDLLKIDVEGMDDRILAAIPPKQFRKIRFIHAEFLSKDRKKRTTDILIKNGFRIKAKWFTDEDCEFPYGEIYAENEHWNDTKKREDG